MATAAAASHALATLGDDFGGGDLGLVDYLSSLERRNAELEEANHGLRASLERAERLAHMDALTGLGNRRYFDSVAPSELQRAARTHDPLTLFLCDVDNFKVCNDQHGHGCGDAVLVSVATVLRTFCRRGGDLAIRYGGDEFALLLPGIGERVAAQFAEGLREAVECSAVRFCGRVIPHKTTLSIGSATFRGAPACSASELVNAADRALFRAKRDGRNRTASITCGPPAVPGR